MKFEEDLSEEFHDMSVNLASHNLEVALKHLKEEYFQAAKKTVAENAKKARAMDTFVRSQYSDEPHKMAEWEEFMQQYEFLDEEDEE